MKKLRGASICVYIPACLSLNISADKGGLWQTFSLPIFDGFSHINTPIAIAILHFGGAYPLRK